MKLTQAGKRIGIGLILIAFVASCSTPSTSRPSAPKPGSSSNIRTQRPYQVKGIWYYPIPSAEGYIEEGMASWYGTDFHGKPTSCGEPYDMWAMTAAHKTLPLGTHVKVSNLDNGRSIIVRVNDRGPFVQGRIIDLSCKAAREIGSAKPGLARVRVEAVQVASEQHIGKDTYWKVDPIPSFRYGQFTIQIGSFKEQGNALRLRGRMSQGFKEIQVSPFSYQGDYFYRVQVGLYRDLVLARQELDRLRQQGFNDAFVVAMEEK